VRLSADQYKQVAAAARARDLPVSTLARNALMAQTSQIPDGVNRRTQASPSEPAVVQAALEEALRQILKPELLKSS
jgi:hypothetical protein